VKYSDGGRKAIFIGGFGYFENRQSGGFVGFLSFLLPCAGNGMSQCRLRHSGLEPESSRRASARREKSFQPKSLGWLDSGSRPE